MINPDLLTTYTGGGEFEDVSLNAGPREGACEKIKGTKDTPVAGSLIPVYLSDEIDPKGRRDVKPIVSPPDPAIHA